MEKKEKYEFADVEIIRFGVSDIITTSGEETKPVYGSLGSDANGWTTWS